MVRQVHMGTILGGGPREGTGEAGLVQRIGVVMGDRHLEGESRQVVGVGVKVGEMGGDTKVDQQRTAGAEWMVQMVGKKAGECEGGLVAMVAVIRVGHLRRT